MKCIVWSIQHWIQLSMTRKQVTTFNIKVFSVYPDNSIWKWYQSSVLIVILLWEGWLASGYIHENSTSASTAKNWSQLATRLSRLSCLGKYNYGFLQGRTTIGVFLHGCMNFKLYFSELNICNLSSSERLDMYLETELKQGNVLA